MTKNILIIGSTGKLGKLLINYCQKNDISIDAITSYKNFKLQVKQQSKLNIKHGFCLSKNEEIKKFNKFIKSRKFKIQPGTRGNPALRQLKHAILRYSRVPTESESHCLERDPIVTADLSHSKCVSHRTPRYTD